MPKAARIIIKKCFTIMLGLLLASRPLMYFGCSFDKLLQRKIVLL
jgi:hypothetical protein